MKLGVFDSGIGGLSVAKALQQAFPHAEIIFKNDSANVPYGTRNPEEILQLVVPILESLVMDGCDLIVIACNTVSTTLINDLRGVLKVPLVAMEPMVKPASSMTSSGVIAVCATPTTLASQRYQWLKETYASDVTVLEPNCRDWSGMIERNEIDETLIASEIYDLLNRGADVIVLGCTHYHWIEEEIQALARDRAVVIQPEPAIIRQVERVLLDL
jgi:glutamate racemase